MYVCCLFPTGKVYSLEGVMVVTARQGFKPAQVTLKRTLLEHSKKKGFATNFTDFKVHTHTHTHTLSLNTVPYYCIFQPTCIGLVFAQVGMVQPGCVKKLMDYGCFVEFPHGISGLAPLKLLTDQFISSASGVYQEMQTVWAKVN